MEPRLKSSTQWTPFPEDFITEILKMVKKTFPTMVAQGDFLAEGRIYKDEVLFRLGFLESGRLRQLNFETSLPASQKHALAQINASIDAAATMLQTYIEEPETDFPRDWKEVGFGNKKVYMRLSTVNTKLESDADTILGLNEKKLVQNEDVD